MRYLLALICPPAALLVCERPWQALLSLIFCLAGLASVHWGVGLVGLLGCILWASNVVGNDQASEVSARFIRTVKPIPITRD